jgi:hypothetical protein
MKKLIKRVLFWTLIGTIIVGCEKEESEIVTPQEQKNNISNKTKLINNKNGEEVTFISEENFESEFESFSQTFFTDHPLGLIDIEYIPSSLQYKLTTQDEGPTEPSGERVICRSSDHGTMLNCYNLHRQFAIGFDDCEYYWIERPYNGGRVWEGHVDC